MKILITGVSGFVGRALVNNLVETTNYQLIGIQRRTQAINIPCEIIKNFKHSQKLMSCLNDVDVVIHLAGRVHRLKDKTCNRLADYREDNVELTTQLVQKALSSGVKRFIFVSSIKVNGNSTKKGNPFTPSFINLDYQKLSQLNLTTDKFCSLDPYAVSKFESEHKLINLCNGTDMDFVIIRPPLIYGSGVKGNFNSLIKLAYRNVPLPLASINNQRSLVYIENFVSLLKLCIDHRKAANQTFLVSDDCDLSTSELYCTLVSLFGHKPRLYNFPNLLLKSIFFIFGKSSMYTRLCGNLQVDINKTKKSLNWSPPITVQEALKQTVRHWLSINNKTTI